MMMIRSVGLFFALAALAVTSAGCSKDESTGTGGTSKPGCQDSTSGTGGRTGGSTGDSDEGSSTPTPPGGEEGGDGEGFDEGGGLAPLADPCGTSSSSSGTDSSSSSSSSSNESHSFCLGGSGWTCPTADAKSACLKGSCGSCTKDPSQCQSDSSDDEDDEE